MTLPNSSIATTPGSGETVATHIINSKEYLSCVLADATGHLIDDPVGVYSADSDIAHSVTPGTNGPLLSLLNGDSSLIVDVIAVWARVDSGGDNGVARNFRLRRITAHSNGATFTPSKLDTNTGALDADIVLRRATSGSNLVVTLVSEEALSAINCYGTNPGGGQHQLFGNNYLWNSFVRLSAAGKREAFPLVVRPSEGIAVISASGSITASRVGIIFRVR